MLMLGSYRICLVRVKAWSTLIKWFKGRWPHFSMPALECPLFVFQIPNFLYLKSLSVFVLCFFKTSNLWLSSSSLCFLKKNSIGLLCADKELGLCLFGFLCVEEKFGLCSFEFVCMEEKLGLASWSFLLLGEVVRSVWSWG